MSHVRYQGNVGAPTIDMSHFKVPGNFLRMGRSPVQIDVITDAAGINFKDCYARKEDIIVDTTLISVISRNDLIKNKRATGRTRDIADAETLEKWNKKKKNNARVEDNKRPSKAPNTGSPKNCAVDYGIIFLGAILRACRKR